MTLSRLASQFGMLHSAVSIIFGCGPCKEAFIVHTGYRPISLQGVVAEARSREALIEGMGRAFEAITLQDAEKASSDTAAIGHQVNYRDRCRKGAHREHR